MRYTILVILVSFFVAACGGGTTNTNNTIVNTNTAAATPEKQNLSTVERPQSLKDKMASRGEQDAALPTLKIVEPKSETVVASSTVKVKLDISGDLKGYKPHMDHETKMGNHIHVILDNQPYEAYYNLDQEFELRNVTDGEHTLRVFPSRPWHESYKNDGAFQIVKFSVKNGGADTTKPATTSNGNTVANANTAPTPEGKEMKESKAGAVDPKKPLLTYSRPKGEYKGADAEAIMIDFWLSNASLYKGLIQTANRAPQPTQYFVRYSVDGGPPVLLDSWEPIWLTGWTAGKHNIKLELVDKDGNVVDNGGYNSTTREITITK